MKKPNWIVKRNRIDRDWKQDILEIVRKIDADEIELEIVDDR